MTYNPNIPQPTDLISISQPRLLTNFQQLNLVYGDPANSDHYAFDDATPNARKHRQVRLVQQVASPAFAATQGTLFTRNNFVGGVTRTDAYYNFDNGAIGNNFTIPAMPVKAMANFNSAGQLSANSFNVIGPVPAIVGGYRVSFINKLSDAAAGTNFDYVVLINYDMSGASRIVSYDNLHNNGFDILVNGNINTISFAVLTL